VSIRSLLAASAAVAAVVAALDSPAAAQVVLRVPGRTFVVPGPGLSVQFGAPGFAAPGYALPRRPLAAAALGWARPYVAPLRPLPGARWSDGNLEPARRNYAARPQLPADDTPLPTEAELRAMADNELLNAVLQLSARLDADLNRFTSAASWQRYFRLPDDAFPAPVDGRVTLGLRSIERLSEDFDAVAANPNYAQIFSLPSFAATRMALAETTRRFGSTPATPATNDLPLAADVPARPHPGPLPDAVESIDAPVGEELPAPRPITPDLPAAERRPTAVEASTSAPALVAPQNVQRDERSILSR
jgi:hypothetical protein